MNYPRTSRSILTICRRLRREYGPVKLGRRLPPLDELIFTILSQHTSDSNSEAAFTSLQNRFADWDAVRRARVASIAKAIKSGGLANQKAPRIKAILQETHERHGSLSLDFLCQMPDDEAVEYLCGFNGVGPKTAACVLMFSCRKPVLPVDTHVHRVSKRLGLIDEKTNAERAHVELAELVPKDSVIEFHVQLIRHGRRVCTARSPKCEGCVLVDRCPEGHRVLSVKTRT